MIKFKKINKKLMQKLTAFTLVATMNAAVLPAKRVSAQEDSCPMYEQSVTYNTDQGDFTVNRYHDNSIEVTQNNTANKITISNKGNVEIITDNGVSCSKESFQINNFNPGNIDIDNSCIKDKDLKKCTKAIEKYFNSNNFNDTNYLDVYKNEIVYDSQYGLDYQHIEQVSKQQYDDTYLKYMEDLNKNGVNVKYSSVGALALPMMFTGSMAASSTAELGILASLLAPQTLLLIVGVAAILAYDQVISDDAVLSIDDIYDENIEQVSINLSTALAIGCVTMADAQTTIEDNFEDNNPDNDYFVCYLVDDPAKGNMLYVDVLNPKSMSEAANILKDKNLKNENIYTVSPFDAKNIFYSIGGTPGTSNSDPKNIGKAECHAFKNSYDAFNKTTNLYNIQKLVFNPNMKPGMQYWHFHFWGKRWFDNNQGKDFKIEKHVFFGLPMVITQDDVKNYGGSTTDIYVAKQKGSDLLNQARDGYNKVKKLGIKTP